MGWPPQTLAPTETGAGLPKLRYTLTAMSCPATLWWGGFLGLPAGRWEGMGQAVTRHRWGGPREPHGPGMPTLPSCPLRDPVGLPGVGADGSRVTRGPQWPQLMAPTMVLGLCSQGAGAPSRPCGGSRASSCLLLLTDEPKVLGSGFLPHVRLMESAGSAFWS